MTDLELIDFYNTNKNKIIVSSIIVTDSAVLTLEDLIKLIKMLQT